MANAKIAKFRLIPGTKYEITISPCDKLQGLFKPLARLNRFYREVTPLLDRLKTVSRYKLYVECSEQQHQNKQSSQCRLHFHGWIIFDDPATYLVEIANMICLQLDIQLNEYRKDYWPEYCKKQGYMEQYCLKHYEPWEITHLTDTSKPLKNNNIHSI